MPVIFVSDFGPMPALDIDGYSMALEKLGREGIPKPQTVLVMSGHWIAKKPLLISSSARPEIIYDFTGFPKQYYEIKYPCPGNPEVANEALRLFEVAGISAKNNPSRGIDHGAWVPLSRVFPKADVPIVQVSVPAGEDPLKIIEIGRALIPLREKGVLIVGAGTLIHNLGLVRFGSQKVDGWAEEFDSWIESRLEKLNIQEIAQYRKLAPSAKLAAPTTEHFDPLFFVLGASDSDLPTNIFQTIRHGNGSLRIIGFGMGKMTLPEQRK